MKKLIQTTTTVKTVKDLISYYKSSAYVRTDELRDLAIDLLEDDSAFEETEIKEDEEIIEKKMKEILQDAESELEGYEYVECEFQGDYSRHIWHKIAA